MTGTPYAYHPPGSILRGGGGPLDRRLRAVDPRLIWPGGCRSAVIGCQRRDSGG